MTIDIAGQIGAIVREVQNREHQGKPARVILATRTYDTTIDDLWNAITTVERIVRWFAPVTGDLRLGGRYQIKGNASGEITRCDAPKHLALTWEFGGDTTWVDVRLTAEGERTRLDLEHVAHVDPERWNEFGPGAVGVGWDLTLLGLALHVLAPTAPHPSETEWLGTDEGKAFVRGSSAGWGKASIASGTDVTAAEAAAKRTTVAYGGEPPPDGDAPKDG